MTNLINMKAVFFIVFIFCFFVLGCETRISAFANIEIQEKTEEINKKILADYLEVFLERKEIFRESGTGGYSEITGKDGAIFFTSRKFIVSIRESNESLAVQFYEQSGEFSQTGNEILSQLVNEVRSLKGVNLVSVDKVRG